MQVQDLLERSKSLKSRAEALIQEMGESKEYWQIRILESERWLLAKNIDNFQKDLMKRVEEARLTVSNPDDIWLEAHKFETGYTPTLERVNQYIFSTRKIKNYEIDLPAMSKMMEKEDVKYRWVEFFESTIEELKKQIMEGRKDNLLRGRVEEIVYNLF